MARPAFVLGVLSVGGDVPARRLEIPSAVTDKDLPEFFKNWCWDDDPDDDVILDFSRCEFLSPGALAMFCTYGVWLREVRGCNVAARIDPATSAGSYACQAGLHEFLGEAEHKVAAPPEGRVFKLTCVEKSSQIPPTVASAMELLAIEDEEIAGAIKYSLVELLRNVVQHSQSRVGGIVTATYFPNTGLVQLVVADAGIGIRAALRDKYREITKDYSAVRFAMQPHVSGTFEPGAYARMAENAGLGLFFIKEIVSRSGGGFFLGSGEMLADVWGSQEGSTGKRYVSATRGGWRGTFAVLQLRRDHIAEFASLLQKCREIAAQVRKDPVELSLDFVDEVPDIDGLRVIRVNEFEEDVEAAGAIRATQVIPGLRRGDLVVLDFEGIRFATQSFAHACMYEVLRDCEEAKYGLTIAGASPATREAIRAVGAYARVEA